MIVYAVALWCDGCNMAFVAGGMAAIPHTDYRALPSVARSLEDSAIASGWARAGAQLFCNGCQIQQAEDAQRGADGGKVLTQIDRP